MLRTVVIFPGEAEHDRITKLLPTIFPKEELVPPGIAEAPLPYLCFYDNEEFIGFAEVFKTQELHYLKYMAMLPQHRSKGYGGKMLKLILAERGGLPLALDIEPPDENAVNSEQRVRRFNFYLKHGLVDTGFLFCFGKSSYLIMSTGEKEVPEIMQYYCSKCRLYAPGYLKIVKREDR